MKKVVFLDYDGVVNRKLWSTVDGKWVCCYGYPEDGVVNDTQAVQWVSEFCQKYGYDIVVTSTWRKYPEWEQCLRNAGLRSGIKIIGATSLPTKDRATEISDYLSNHPEIETYLVFDDDESLLKNKNDDTSELGTLFDEKGVHSDNLILCNKEHGFGEEEYTMAIATHLSLKYRNANNVSTVALSSADVEGSIEATIELLYAVGELSTSLLQRSFKIGYGRAAAMIDSLIEKDIVFTENKHGRIKYKPLLEYDEAKTKI